MKKILAFCLLAALLLTGCGQAAPETTEPSTVTQDAATETVPQTTEATEPPVTTQGSDTEPMPTGTVSGRPLYTELESNVEGTQVFSPATLYEGEGYSLYVPDGDFQMAEEGRWTFSNNEELAFEVIFYPGVTEEDLCTAITPSPLTQGEDGRWFMTKQDGTGWDAPCLDVWLYPAEDGVYALYSRYFLEAAEGFGVRMSAVAASFEITK